MIVLVSIIWWGGIIAGATAVAVRRPLASIRVTTAILGTVVAVWLLLCGLGIAAQLQRGPGMEAVGRETQFDAPHKLLNHVAVVSVTVALCAAVPLAIERAVRGDGAARLVLHLTLALATEILVLLSAFTGYFGRPPVTVGSYFRFRVLHTIAVPLIATLTLLGWCHVARRYRGAFKPSATTA